MLLAFTKSQGTPTMFMRSRWQWFLGFAIILGACHHGARGQEIALLSEVPTELAGVGSALIVATSPQRGDAVNEDVFIVMRGEEQPPRRLFRHGVGRFDVDQDNLYYVEYVGGAAYVVSLSGGQERQLAPTLQGHPAAVEAANGSMLVLSADFDLWLRRIDVRTAALTERRVPDIASN